MIRGTNTASGCENRRIGRRFPPRARKKKEKKTETTFYPAPNNYPTREFLPSISISRACKSRTTQHKTENLLNRWSTRGFARIVANRRVAPIPLPFDSFKIQPRRVLSIIFLNISNLKRSRCTVRSQIFKLGKIRERSFTFDHVIDINSNLQSFTVF